MGVEREKDVLEKREDQNNEDILPKYFPTYASLIQRKQMMTFQR